MQPLRSASARAAPDALAVEFEGDGASRSAASDVCMLSAAYGVKPSACKRTYSTASASARLRLAGDAATALRFAASSAFVSQRMNLALTTDAGTRSLCAGVI